MALDDRTSANEVQRGRYLRSLTVVLGIAVVVALLPASSSGASSPSAHVISARAMQPTGTWGPLTSFNIDLNPGATVTTPNQTTGSTIVLVKDQAGQQIALQFSQVQAPEVPVGLCAGWDALPTTTPAVYFGSEVGVVKVLGTNRYLCGQKALPAYGPNPASAANADVYIEFPAAGHWFLLDLFRETAPEKSLNIGAVRSIVHSIKPIAK
jgi:hypothetical protein